MPKPAPAICQWLRCSGVAFRRRGYHASGTLTIRPSARSTTSNSSVRRTPTIRSAALGFEVFIPSSKQMFLMLDDKPFDRFQLMYRIAEVRSNRDRFQPKFRGAILAVDVHMRRLARIAPRNFG